MTRCTHVWHQRGKSLQQNAFIAQEWRQSVSNRLKPCPHCRRKVRLSPNEFGDSLTFLRQCGRCLTYLRLGVSQLGLDIHQSRSQNQWIVWRASSQKLLPAALQLSGEFMFQQDISSEHRKRLFDFNISQGSEATRLQCGEIFNDRLLVNFLESASERIHIVVRPNYLAKTVTIVSPFFWLTRHTVYILEGSQKFGIEIFVRTRHTTWRICAIPLLTDDISQNALMFWQFFFEFSSVKH